MDESGVFKLPMYSSSVKAGFPSPADEHVENYIDLNTHLIPHPAATFIVRASGDSMFNAGIFEGDLLLVDKSLEPVHGKIVIAALGGELTVKRLFCHKGVTELRAENARYAPITIKDDLALVIWGVVIHSIRSF